MNIFLIRSHEPEGENVAPEVWNKPLSQSEIADIESLLPAMKGLTGQIDMVLTGMELREMITADTIARFFKSSHFIKHDKHIDIDGAEKEVVKWINTLIGKENLVVVVANPLLGRLIDFMTSSKEGSKRTPFKKNEFALVNYSGFIVPGAGRLKWIKELPSQ